MSHIAKLKDERAPILERLKDLAKAAESGNRPFTPAEKQEIDGLLSKSKHLGEEIARFEGIIKSTSEIDALLAKADDDSLESAMRGIQRGATGTKGSALGRVLAKSLFGGMDLDASGMEVQRRAFMDPNGNDVQMPRMQAGGYNALTAASGRAVATLPHATGLVFGMPEAAAAVLALMPKPELSIGDEYSFYRQTNRDPDTAEFVPRRGQKPESSFAYERVKDRVRTVAVLSDPIPRQDLADLTGLTEEIGYELARRVVYKIEQATIAGDSEADEESFDGIINTTGVRQQAFAVSVPVTIRTAITTLEADGFNVTAVALNPVDWQAIELLTDEVGQPLYPNLYTARQEPVLFGRPVVISNKVPAGTAILGDWAYCLVTVREDIELAWSDGGDLFETNTVRFRAEARVGFNVLHPTAFTVATLTAPEPPVDPED